MAEDINRVGGCCRDWHRYSGLDQLSVADMEERITFPDLGSFHTESIIPQVAWLGHGSILLVWRGQRILIDPVFSKFVGVFPRRCPVPRKWRELLPDSIFLTHAHMDHLDVNTLLAFKETRIFLPGGSERFLRGQLKDREFPVQTDESIDLGSIRVHSVPARHGGWRYPWQRGCQAFGYIFSDGDYTIYLAGDSAYGEHFKGIGRRHSIDLALLPIGAYSPRWFLKSRHLNPEEAVRACKDLGARKMIPYHFGTYRLSWEVLSEPLPRFARCAAEESCNWHLPVGL